MDAIGILLISIIGPILGAILGIIRYPTRSFIFNMLAFAAGVMLSISFLNLIPQSIELSSIIVVAIGIVLGSGMMFIMDKTLPHNHPEIILHDNKSEYDCDIHKSSKYLTTGLFIHNFPEGMVMALGTVTEASLGILIAIAITVQKIPEGMCISSPSYYCNKNRWKAFWLSCSTLIPLIIGFLFAYFLYQNVSLTVVGLITAMTAGFMIYISADELIPASSKKMTNQVTIISFVIGILFVVLLNSVLV